MTISERRGEEAARCGAAASCLAAAVLALTGTARAQAPPAPFELSLEELGDVRVVSLYRRAEMLSDVAASVFVITAEDIRRAGVRSLPEALRLAPGVEVARNGASSWTISIRGFNSDLSNKLLVLIDGRSVYSPLFGGVFWDVQDTLLADIARIEVIAGPGGTVWGANAVNGVVNIITRSASETHGAYFEGGAGTEEQGWFGFRYGGEIGSAGDARVYVKGFERDALRSLDGSRAADGWRMSQGGFSMGWNLGGADRVTLRGDVYDGEESALLRGDFTLGTLPDFDVPGTVDVAGHNLLARWRRSLGTEGGLRLQLYHDHTSREIPFSFNEERDTIDVDFQHDLRPSGRHAFAWGAALGMTSDELDNTLFATFEPASRTDRTLSAFVQDRVRLGDDRLTLTFGTKLEHNDYTGFEAQPNVRAAWLVDESQTVWGAVSRAVRPPARLNTDLELMVPIPGAGTPVPLYVAVSGTADYRSEEVLAYEAGYRLQAGRRMSIDVAVFDNYYDNLQTQEPGTLFAVPAPMPYLVLPATLENGMDGESYGATILANWQPLRRLRLRFQYSRLELDLELEPGSGDAGAVALAGNSPKHQLAVHSFAQLPFDLSLYAAARYVDELPSLDVDSYLAVDFNLIWQAWPAVEVALTGRNLNDRRHVEFGDGAYVERAARLGFSWSF